MQWVWTWAGKCFGYIKNGNLFTHTGKQVGKFYDTEVYGSDGRYLGELRNKDRLIRNTQKKFFMKPGFVPIVGGGYAKYADYPWFVMLAGHEDFSSEELIV